MTQDSAVESQAWLIGLLVVAVIVALAYAEGSGYTERGGGATQMEIEASTSPLTS